MARMETPVCDFGWKAIDFILPGVDGKRHQIADVMGENGLLVMFICNHCPYVKSVIERIVRDCEQLSSLGIGSIAIMSNDTTEYPEDSFASMINAARQMNFSFPYVLDESQTVARAYGAVCTPDFFGFNNKRELQYRGRLDASRKEPIIGARRELFEAMSLIARTGKGPAEQHPSMGCSIKWRKENATPTPAPTTDPQ